MNIAFPDGSTVVDFPLIEREVVSSLAERLVIDGGAIKIDSAHDNLDNAHLVLDGVLEQGQEYFKIMRSGVKQLSVDYNGILQAPKGIVSPEITFLGNDVATNRTAIENSTHLNTHNTLVKRDNTSTTTFQSLTTNILNASQDVAMYGDCALTYTPQDSQGTNLSGYTYRFGRNTEELGDFSGLGNGLELAEPNDPITSERMNQILIQVNEGTPTIEMIVNKSPSEDWLLIRDKDLEPVLSLNSSGCHIRTVQKAFVNLTPGNTLSLNTLTEGMQSHWFQLSSPWTGNTTETEIEISEAAANSSKKMIRGLEILIDDLGTASEIQSRIFIKRWGVYRHDKQRLWVVIGLELRNSETQIAGNTKFRLSFNNKIVLE